MASLRDTLISGMLLVGILYFLARIFGLTVSPTQILVVLGIFAVLAIAARRAADVQVGFVIITFSLLLVLTEYVFPDVVAEAMNPLYQIWLLLTGIDLAAIEPIRLTIFLTIVVGAMIYLRVRVSGEKQFTNTTTDKVFGELGNYWRRYAQLLRLSAFFLFALLVFVLSNVGEFLGEFGNVLADVPVISSNFIAIALGYFALDGELPGIGEVPFFVDVGATGFVILTVAVLAAAMMAKESSSGPLARLVRNR